MGAELVVFDPFLFSPPNQKTEEKKRNGGTSYSLAPAPKPVCGARVGLGSRGAVLFSRLEKRVERPPPNQKLVWGRVQGNMMCLCSFSFPLFFGLGAGAREYDDRPNPLPISIPLSSSRALVSSTISSSVSGLLQGLPSSVAQGGPRAGPRAAVAARRVCHGRQGVSGRRARRPFFPSWPMPL